MTETETRPHVLLADDHEMLRGPLSSYMTNQGGFDVVEASDYNETHAALEAHGPFDLVVLDYAMPGMNGLDSVSDVIEQNGRKPVAILSGIAPSNVAEDVFALGAAGFLPKTMPIEDLIATMREMIAGARVRPDTADTAGEEAINLIEKLSMRERQVLDGLCRGMSNKEIARELELQEVTIKLHVKTLCRKIEARNRTHAAVIAKDARLF